VKTFIRMMMVFWVLGIICPQISKTNISYHNIITPPLHATQTVIEASVEMNALDYFEILDEIFSLDISEHSKIRSIKEAYRQGQLDSLGAIKDDCIELSETPTILKCMGLELIKIKRSDLLSIPGKISDIILGACLKMETYSDESVCYESLVNKFLSVQVKSEATKCMEISVPLERVYCYRKIL